MTESLNLGLTHFFNGLLKRQDLYRRGAESAEKKMGEGFLSGPKLPLTDGEVMVRGYYYPSGKSLSCFFVLFVAGF